MNERTSPSPTPRATSRVRRRRLFYVAGFDPAGAGRYHRIYEEEAARHAARTGLPIKVGPLDGDAWTVTARHPEGPVEIRHEVLAWHDIVRSLWARNELELLIHGWAAFFAYWRRGLMRLGRREAPLLVVASTAPVAVSTAVLLAYVFKAAALGALAGVAAKALGAPPWIAFLVFATLLIPLPWAWRGVDRLIPVGWLARGMHGVSTASAGRAPDLDRRLDEFAGRILDASQEPGWDEVLIVGHSMGAQLAAQALGRAAARDPDLGRATPVNLLTLGQLIPLYTAMTRDPAYAADFRSLMAAEQVGWLDVASPADAGGACGLHPFVGLDLPRRRGRPLRLSPRFHKVVSPETFRRLRRSPLDFHFQYIKAAEAEGDYDFFRLVAGPHPLTGTPEADAALARPIDR
ncbi:MAG TPA: hypothetical protein VF559_05450 [Caulobacteraceae bacterium]